MSNLVVVHSRKGGVGKSTTAYELAWLLEAVLVDLDWEQGGLTYDWGYRWQDRMKSPVLAAIEGERTPKPLKGFRKPLLLPSHPDYVDALPEADERGDLLVAWTNDWGSEYVVVDTHPGATGATNGALSRANVVVSPVELTTKCLNATEAMIDELADYPLVLIPNMVPRYPPKQEIKRLRSIVSGTPVQVGPLLPLAPPVKARKKHMAITAEDKPAKRLAEFAASMREVANFVKEYVNA